MEAVGLLVFLEREAHILEEFHLADVAAQADGNAVGEMRLHIHHEIFALRPLLGGSFFFRCLCFVHVESLAIDRIHCGKTSGQPHGSPHELAAIHGQLLGFLFRHFADQMFDMLLPFVLRARNELLGGKHLGRNG